MNKLLFSVVFFLLANACHSQSKNDLLIGVQSDLIKTNNTGYFQRFQVGAEGNYFLFERFGITGGIEYWSAGRELSLTTGARWYPIDDAFFRVRGLLGANDFSLGAGWSMPLTLTNLRFEALGDFYFAGHIAIRAGFTYTLPRWH